MKFNICMSKLVSGNIEANYNCLFSELSCKENVILFPSLFLSGASVCDLFLFPAFIDKLFSYTNKVLADSLKFEKLIGFGTALFINKKLVNCYIFVFKGQVLGLFTRNELPYEDLRYFSACSEKNINLFGQDITVNEKFSFENKTFDLSFALNEKLTSATYLISPLSCAERIGGDFTRRNLTRNISAKNKNILIAFGRGLGESTESQVYSGHVICGNNGQIFNERKTFDETKNVIIDTKIENEIYFNDKGFESISAKFPFVPKDLFDFNLTFNLLTEGLRKRIESVKAKNLFLGVSGGSDSALTLIVASLALKKLNMPVSSLKCILMKGLGSGEKSYNLAKRLVLSFGLDFSEIPISPAVLSHFKDIAHDGSTNLAYENTQARERTQILLDLSNMHNGIMLGTGDLSEEALGFSTFGGDHLGNYNCISGVPKTFLLHLLKYYGDLIGGTIKDVLYEIASMPISPELKAEQKTEDIVGPYMLIDFFVDNLKLPKNIILERAGLIFDEFDKKDLEKYYEIFISRFKTAQFKRNCSPDGIKIFNISLNSKDLRLPSDISLSL